MSEKTDRQRFSVTLTPAYVAALDRLVDVGIYLDYQDAIRALMRRGFLFYGLEPFTPEQPEEAR